MSIWVMRGKWDGVEEEMIVQCHGWPSLECACVDEMTNGVSVISHGPILLGGCECGHMKRRVMLAGQSRPSRAGDHQCSRNHHLARAARRGAPPPLRAFFRSVCRLRCGDSSWRHRDHCTMPVGRGPFPGGARRHGSTIQCGAGRAASSRSVDSMQAVHDEASRARLESALMSANLPGARARDPGSDLEDGVATCCSAVEQVLRPFPA